MEIPQNLLNIFKCCECDELLSCGPVTIIHETGRAVCGRCNNLDSGPKDSIENYGRTRSEQYEAAAQLLAFPCKNAAQGCTKKLKFSATEPNRHEKLCIYKKFICPLVPIGSCNWIGTSRNLKKHCKKEHRSQLFHNTCSPPRPDLTISKLYTYLISALRHIFLLHIKVCVTSGKLYYSIRMFAEEQHLINYSFAFNIEGNSSIISKSCSVLPTDLLTIQESSANCILINNLLGILNGNYNDTIFTISIKALHKFCLNCEKQIENVADLKYCHECEGKLKICKFRQKGCLFMDVDWWKCKRHENYFCQYQRKCFCCGMELVRGSLIEHLESYHYHKIIKSNFESVIRIRYYDINKLILISSNIGFVICEFVELSISDISLCLHTSLHSHELKKFLCSVKLTDPQTKHTQVITPEIVYNGSYDWCFNLSMTGFTSWLNSGIDININIDEI